MGNKQYNRSLHIIFNTTDIKGLCKKITRNLGRY